MREREECSVGDKRPKMTAGEGGKNEGWEMRR